MFPLLISFVLTLEEEKVSEYSYSCHSKLLGSFDGLKYVNISKIKEENKKNEFNIINNRTNEQVAVFLSDALKNSIDLGDSEIKGCKNVDDYVYLIRPNTTISISIEKELFMEDIILLGFLGGKECGRIYFTTYGKDNCSVVTLISSTYTCVYHMVKNHVTYVNGSVLKEREGVIDDGQILKFGGKESMIFNLNLDTSTASIKNENGTRRSVKAPYSRSIQSEEWEVTNATVAYNYLIVPNFEFAYDDQDISLASLVVIGMIIACLAYWILGCCVGDCIEGYLDDRSNPFFQETLSHYK